MDNILVVGGTGMLSDVVVWLNRKGNNITLLSRNKERLNNVNKECEFPDNNRLISLDYRESDRLRKIIEKEQQEHGNYTIVLVWIHSTAPDALKIIIDNFG